MSSSFPNESPGYRAARDKLLEAEKRLRGEVEAVAALRRALPAGGAVPQDYVFEEGTDPTGQVRLSELFPAGKDTLVIYSFMYGPNAKAACPMCTCFLDGLDGNAQHIAQRIGLAVVARSPIARIREFASSRGWRNLRLLSSSTNSFNTDYHAESADGSQESIIHTFVKDGETVRHTYSSELQLLPSEPGQNTRHIDLMWPLWNVMDLTPGGRGESFPKLVY